MNQIADKRATEAAISVRRAKEGVGRRKVEEMKVATLAHWLGRATFAANNGHGEGIRDTTAERKDGGGQTQAGEAEEGNQRGVRQASAVGRAQFGGGDPRVEMQHLLEAITGLGSDSQGKV